ncbi:hypothetical protein EVG20_g5271 [Dentipellis fragilis]|uniref:Uncharacterized protein n=1 Tax=Dentipellis fragilis TaxID=205917 RepID=A0A4Y9YXG4_9AGAM|nr:hypothetical protein EVG20_g5271 [Dentipellis fragilis]
MASSPKAAYATQDSAPTETQYLTAPEPTTHSEGGTHPVTTCSLPLPLLLRSDSPPPGYSRMDTDAAMRMPKHVYSPPAQSDYVPPAILPMIPGPSAMQHESHNADADAEEKDPQNQGHKAGCASTASRVQSPCSHKDKPQQVMCVSTQPTAMRVANSDAATAAADPNLPGSTSRAGREHEDSCCELCGEYCLIHVCSAVLDLVCLPLDLVDTVLSTLYGAYPGTPRPEIDHKLLTEKLRASLPSCHHDLPRRILQHASGPLLPVLHGRIPMPPPYDRKKATPDEQLTTLICDSCLRQNTASRLPYSMPCSAKYSLTFPSPLGVRRFVVSIQYPVPLGSVMSCYRRRPPPTMASLLSSCAINSVPSNPKTHPLNPTLNSHPTTNIAPSSDPTRIIQDSALTGIQSLIVPPPPRLDSSSQAHSRMDIDAATSTCMLGHVNSPLGQSKRVPPPTLPMTSTSPSMGRESHQTPINDRKMNMEGPHPLPLDQMTPSASPVLQVVRLPPEHCQFGSAPVRNTKSSTHSTEPNATPEMRVPDASNSNPPPPPQEKRVGLYSIFCGGSERRGPSDVEIDSE